MTYDTVIETRAQEVFNAMAGRVGSEDMERLQGAFQLAREAHAPQRRRSGEPYILHPIAVAMIAATELQLDVNSVIAAFLHDVVEDTQYTLEDIRLRFGEDVAFLVGVVTKAKKERYEDSKQVDNFRQMLASVQYDIRALLVKLADRLHNMRTLSSMRPDKQMKIAGETDYFYAPLANRLGFYGVKTELENLGMRFRTPHEYDALASMIETDRAQQSARLAHFMDQVRQVLRDNDIVAEVSLQYRSPYSLQRKMHKYGDDFNHLKYRHFTLITFPTPFGVSEKDMALRIYSLLTDRFKEKPGGISNYIDSPKENGYQSFHVKLLADFGRWQEVHISSQRMVRDSQLGCVAERSDGNIQRWLDKFRHVLQEIAQQRPVGSNFIDTVVTSFYNDDIMTFTPCGQPVVLPQRATVLDFAYEVDPQMGQTAKYARVNGFLTPIKAPLRRGDVVEVFADPACRPSPEWMDHVVTYKAKKAIWEYLESLPKPEFNRCQACRPIPGEEVIGFRGPDGMVTVHRRDCPTAVRMASQMGDDIVSVEYGPDGTLYPVSITIHAVDRYHLLTDIVDAITGHFGLSMSSIHTETVDSLVTSEITFAVHSNEELEDIMVHIADLPGVEDVHRHREG